MAMHINLEHKKVFITGGSGSVGETLVEVFSLSSCRVYFQYHKNKERAMRLVTQFSAIPVRIDFAQDDFVLPDEDFDIIINNAGINIAKDAALQVRQSEWQKTLQVNLTVPYRVSLKYLPGMLKKKWGRVINISSIYGLRGSSNNLPYNVSKHGLSGLTKSIAKEYSAYGITCNEICPGPIESELMDRIATRIEKEKGIPKNDFFQELRNAIPAKRLAKPIEVSWLALFLASDYAAYINGTSIIIDGGLIA